MIRVGQPGGARLSLLSTRQREDRARRDMTIVEHRPGQRAARAGANRLGTIRLADLAQRSGYDKDEICMPELEAINEPDRVAALIRTAAEQRAPRPMATH